MSIRTAGRALAAAALAALAIGSASPAGAAPAVGDPYTASTATTFLRDSRTGLAAEVTVTDAEDEGTRLDIALYKDGWTCAISGEPALATVSTLESAAARGSFRYSCTEDSTQGIATQHRQRAPRTMTGAAGVDLAWTGVGEQRNAPLDHCVGRYILRQATVSGALTLTGDLRGTLRAPDPDDNSHLSYDHHVCPPGAQ